jgi:hypothetical protein
MVISLADRRATWLTVDAELRCGTITQADRQSASIHHSPTLV